MGCHFFVTFPDREVVRLTRSVFIYKSFYFVYNSLSQDDRDCRRSMNVHVLRRTRVRYFEEEVST